MVIAIIINVMKVRSQSDSVTIFSAKVILESGITASTEANDPFGTVKAVLCAPTDKTRQVYAVVVRGQEHAQDQPDHLSLMNDVISATRRSWRELEKDTTKTKPAKGLSKGSGIEVTEKDDIRIYRGCGSPRQFDRQFVRGEGVYLFPSHLKQDTIKNLGLSPLPDLATSNTVVQVGWRPCIIDENVALDEVLSESSSDSELDRESLQWRQAFVHAQKSLSAEEVASSFGTSARNRAATASRWASEGKIFSIRFQGRSLYPAFQFRDGLPLPVIFKMLKEMPDHFSGWDAAFFLTSPNTYLDGGKPLELLRTEPERVVALARAFAHPGDAF